MCVLRWLIVFSLLAANFPSTARAQTYAGIPVTVSIPEVLTLQVQASPALSFNFNSSATLDNGIEIKGTVFTFYSNKAWFATIQTGAPTFLGGDGTMPVSVLKFKNSANQVYTDISVTPQPLLGSSGSKNLRGTGTIGVDFKLDPGYLHPPAQNYAVTVIYTISNL